jgi:hypothetical protein
MKKNVDNVWFLSGYLSTPNLTHKSLLLLGTSQLYLPTATLLSVTISDAICSYDEENCLQYLPV